MKKQITIDDLNQLSEKGKKKYFKYLRSKGIQDLIPLTVTEMDGEGFTLIKLPRLMYLGEMIEFLFEKGKTEISSGEWEHEFYNFSDGNVEIDWYGKNELCDALWELVKSILENQDTRT